jgi:PAS domain-containing protein
MFDHRIIRANGRTRYLHAQGVVLLDEKGLPTRMVGVSQDVTQQKSAEEKLRDMNSQLERMVEIRTRELRIINERLKNNLAEQRQRVRDLEVVLEKFVINAPADGMIIYKRDRMGTKRKVGSSISPWDNVVATLPDMSSMISKTYVNEIDVSKVKPGQQVEILVDAFPEKSYTGQVTSVANIGEQLPNADAKVFEVVIAVNESDPILRPSMTTGNKIITKTIENVTYIPLESVQTGLDSIPFVYLKNGDKQVVVLGESNENNVVVEQGVEPGTALFLSTPENSQDFDIVGEDLIAVIKERERVKKEEELRIKAAAQSSMDALNSPMGGPGGMRGGRQGMNMTPEMREQLQKLRTSGDTAAMRQMMRNMRSQGGQQGANPGGTRDTSARRRVN